MTRRWLFVALLLAAVAPAGAQTVDADLRAERAKYGATIDDKQAAALLNAVAWAHRAEGFGLLAKPGGNHCPQPTTGVLVSCDFLVNRLTGRGWDVLGACVDITTNPPERGTCSAQSLGAGETVDLSRFVAPVDPGTSGGDAPPPSPPPPPPPPSGAATADLQQQELAALLQVIQQLQLQNAALAQQTETLARGLAELKAAIVAGVRIRF